MGLTDSSSDPRVGSATSNSTGGTLSKVSVDGSSKSSSSIGSLVATLVPVLVYSAICLSIFWVLRHRFPRVYAPRSILTSFLPSERSKELPNHFFKWVTIFFRIEDTFALQHISLDAYLLLRFLKVLSMLFFVGMCITWPILIPVHMRGGSGLSQLDSMTIGNVSEKKTFYVHVFVAVIYFSIVLFTIYRECIYYINLRLAYLCSDFEANRLANRTVLFTCVPARYRDPARLKKLFGEDQVENVWVPRNTNALERLVQERTKTALKLEKAEIALIKKANKLRQACMSEEELDALHTKYENMDDKEISSDSERISGDSTVQGESPQITQVVPSSTNRDLLSNQQPNLHNTTTSMVNHPQLPELPSSIHNIQCNTEPGNLCISTDIMITENNTTGLGVAGYNFSLQTGSDSFTTSSTAYSAHVISSSQNNGDQPVRSSSQVGNQNIPDIATTVPEVVVTQTPLPMPVSHVSSGATSPILWAPIQRGMRYREPTTTMDITPRSGNTGPIADRQFVDPETGIFRLPDMSGSVAAQWVPQEERPSHRPFRNFFRRVDTIKWTRKRLAVLNPQIRKMRRELLQGDGTAMASVFIEFKTQAAAEQAFQTLAHHIPSHMSSRYIGVAPEEVIWDKLNLDWFSQLTRQIFITAAVWASIIFWSIPSAFIGLISNIESMAKYLPPLKFILLLPEAIKGIIQGFLPAIMLSLLMAIVPWLLRIAGRLRGLPSLSQIELFVQTNYFPFQVIQVFLITTISSAASAALMNVINSPTSTPKLLSENLPKASNFYISYILVQCLAAGSGGLVHAIDLFRHQVMARNVDHPRSVFKTWHSMKPVHWGSIFPVFSNMGVIALSYCCIAPVIMLFASLGLFIIYLVYRYNLMFTADARINCRGLVYPNALLQLLTGLYIAEICMVGLLALRSALVPMVMMIVYLVFTVACHFSLSVAIKPLLYNLPQTITKETDERRSGQKIDIASDAVVPRPDGTTHVSSPTPAENYDDGYVVPTHESQIPPLNTGNRDLQGADTMIRIVWREMLDKAKKELIEKISRIPGVHAISKYTKYWLVPSREEEPNFLQRWMHPGKFDNFTHLSKLVPQDRGNPMDEYPKDYVNKAYWPPAMSIPPMRLWIPKDDAGVSAQEVKWTSKYVSITDEGAVLLPNGKIKVDVEKAPMKQAKIIY